MEIITSSTDKPGLPAQPRQPDSNIDGVAARKAVKHPGLPEAIGRLDSYPIDDNFADGNYKRL